MRGPGRAAQVASAHWETLTAEAKAIAVETEENGWETLVVHPGSVTAVHEHDRCGLDVVVPGNEYEPLAALVEERGLSFPFRRCTPARRARRRSSVRPTGLVSDLPAKAGRRGGRLLARRSLDLPTRVTEAARRVVRRNIHY